MINRRWRSNHRATDQILSADAEENQPPCRMNKTIAIAAALCGLALATFVFIWLGAGKIMHAVLAIGWRGLFYVVAWQFAVYMVLGLAWRVLLPGVSPFTVIFGRLVREGGETCLPFSEIGGLVCGARAVMLGGVAFAQACASSIVDITAEGIALAPFLLFGLVMLLARRPGASLVLPMALGLGLLVAGGLLAFALRRPIARLLHAGAEKLLAACVKDAPAQADDFERDLQILFGRHGRVAVCAAIHFMCWCGGGGNVWIAYHLLGAHPSVLDALAIEAILSGILAIGFLIPAGLGVQELTYVGVGRLFGMPAHLSLALSLIRRARDGLIGAPCLLIWQAREAKALKA